MTQNMTDMEQAMPFCYIQQDAGTSWLQRKPVCSIQLVSVVGVIYICLILINGNKLLIICIASQAQA